MYFTINGAVNCCFSLAHHAQKSECLSNVHGKLSADDNPAASKLAEAEPSVVYANWRELRVGRRGARHSAMLERDGTRRRGDASLCRGRSTCSRRRRAARHGSPASSFSTRPVEANDVPVPSRSFARGYSLGAILSFRIRFKQR